MFKFRSSIRTRVPLLSSQSNFTAYSSSPLIKLQDVSKKLKNSKIIRTDRLKSHLSQFDLPTTGRRFDLTLRLALKYDDLYTVTKLKKELVTKGISDQGTKDVLLERLLRHSLTVKEPRAQLDSLKVELDECANDFAEVLMEAVPKDLGEGVQVYQLEAPFFESSLIGDLFTRESSREIWDKVLDRVENQPGEHTVVTGNPGIGKSFSGLYFLRQFLLDPGRMFFYEARKSNQMFSFKAMPGGGWKANSCSLGKFSHEDCRPLMKDSRNVLYVDPTRPPKEPFGSCDASVVTAPSPNTEHDHDFLKASDRKPEPCTYYQGPWALDELMVMSFLRDPSLPKEELVRGFNEFGGVPRLRFGKDIVRSQARVKLTTAFEQLDSGVLGRVVASSAADIANSKISSSIWCFFPEDSTYTIPRTGFISNSARLEGIKKNEPLFYEAVLKSIARDPASGGIDFQDYAFHMLSKGGVFEVQKLSGDLASEPLHLNPMNPL